MSVALLDQLFTSRQLVTDPAELITFEVDAGFDRGKPDAVFYPESAADVSQLVQWARTKGLPIVARGAGTGLSGGAVPERGGVIVEFARMKQIVELNTTGRNGVVQTGVVNLTLDAAAKAAGPSTIRPTRRAGARRCSAATSARMPAGRTASSTASPPTTSPASKPCWPTAASSAPAGRRSTTPNST
ncbi:MAG: FAD-binding oxidoreductase [Tetrasphaera sp.]